MADQFDCALDLLRRLNPKNTTKNLSSICTLIPSHEEELLASVDQPLSTRRCKVSGRDYLLCDYNRDGNSYRSPWSNSFDPPIDDAEFPSERIRKLEIKMNDALDIYRELYYDGGTSSAYLWNLDDGFAGVLLVKKSGVNSKSNDASGSWDSIHVLEVAESVRKAKYKLTSTIILNLGSNNENVGTLDLNGNMTRQVEMDMPIDGDGSHVSNIGRMVEDMESKMRNLLQEVYFGKAKDIVGDLRSIDSLSSTRQDRDAQRQMIDSMQK